MGVDYNPQPPGFPDGAYFVQGRQEDPAVLARAVEIADGPFDVVIDDAAHLGPPAKATWEFLYRDHVKAGGYYIFEDYGTALRMPTWSDYQKGWVRPPDDGHRLPT